MIVFTLPIRTKNPLNNSQGFSRGAVFAKAKERREQRRVAAIAMMAQRSSWPTFPIVVTLTRVAPRPFDTDGLAASFKSLRDGIADALGIDDRDPRVRWEYEQRRGAPRQYGVEIRVVAKAEGSAA